MAATEAQLVIDLDALAHNYAALTAEAGGAEVAAVVKADGYGLGAGPVARRLWSEGVRSFFVARLGEAEALRAELGPDRPADIYLLDGLAPGTSERIAAAGLTPVIATVPQAAAAVAWSASAGGLRVALQVDSGMNRQGLTPEEARALVQAPGGLRGLDVALLISHLGSAAEPSDPRNAAQLAGFEAVRALFPGSRASLSASAGVFLGPEYRYDVVRAGVSLYGGGPQDRPDPRLKAVATLTAPLLDVRRLQAGDRVAYGMTFTAEGPMRVGVVAAGYADGILRAAAGRGFAWFAGAKRRLLAVTMDLTVIELDGTEMEVGAPVEFLGSNVALDELAAAAGTVAHEILVRLSLRAQRTYLGAA